MTERNIVSGLYPFFNKRNHKVMVHNTQGALHYVGESDFISINRSDFITEVEIKISRGDYRNDFTKKNRHAHLSGDGYFRKSWDNVGSRDYFVGPQKRMRLHVSCIEERSIHVKPSPYIPNYFYYAFPKGLVAPEEVPEYCGILEIVVRETQSRFHYEVIEVRKPKRLHTRKATEKQEIQILRSQMYRVMSHIERANFKKGWC